MKKKRILYVFSDGRELSYKNGYLYMGEDKNVCVLGSIYKRLLSRIRLFNRLLRLEPRCATFINNDLCAVAFNHHIYIVSISDKIIRDKIKIAKNILSFCSMKQYGEEKLFWGDYGKSALNSKINIYQYSPNDGLKVCYTFPHGAIKHVHNIIFDQYHDKYYILTGDFEEKIGIYIASRDLSEIKPMAIGAQKFRAVVGLPLPNGLLYATDAVMEENFIYFYDVEKEELKKIESINGSVIYGAAVADGLVISTTVESYPSGKSKIKSMLDTRLGLGIKSKDVHVLYVTKDFEVKKIATYRKDIHFMKLMQYGQVFFPVYEDKSIRNIKANPMAVKKYDGKVVELKIS